MSKGAELISPTIAVITGMILVVIFAVMTGVFSYLIGQPIWNVTIGPVKFTTESLGNVMAGIIIIFVIIIFIIAFTRAFSAAE